MEARPTNWGDNLTLIGAVRWTAGSRSDVLAGVTTRFEGGSQRLAPRLRRGDIVLLDNSLFARLDATLGPSVIRMLATVPWFLGTPTETVVP